MDERKIMDLKMVTCNECNLKFVTKRKPKYYNRIKCPACGSNKSFSIIENDEKEVIDALLREIMVPEKSFIVDNEGRRPCRDKP